MPDQLDNFFNRFYNLILINSNFKIYFLMDLIQHCKNNIQIII